jgi:hypothetical protein
VPTLPLTIQGDGYWQGWASFSGAPFAYQCIDDSNGTTHDSGATKINLGRLVLPAGIISFPVMLMAEHMIPQSLTVNVAAVKVGATHPDLQIGFARGSATGFDPTAFTAGVSYSVATRTFSTNPITGLAWSAADLVGLEVCVQSMFGQVGSNDISLVSGSITYIAATNSYAVPSGAMVA